MEMIRLVALAALLLSAWVNGKINDNSNQYIQPRKVNKKEFIFDLLTALRKLRSHKKSKITSTPSIQKEASPRMNKHHASSLQYNLIPVLQPKQDDSTKSTENRASASEETDNSNNRKKKFLRHLLKTLKKIRNYRNDRSGHRKFQERNFRSHAVSSVRQTITPQKSNVGSITPLYNQGKERFSDNKETFAERSDVLKPIQQLAKISTSRENKARYAFGQARLSYLKALEKARDEKLRKLDDLEKEFSVILPQPVNQDVTGEKKDMKYAFQDASKTESEMTLDEKQSPSENFPTHFPKRVNQFTDFSSNSLEMNRMKMSGYSSKEDGKMSLGESKKSPRRTQTSGRSFAARPAIITPWVHPKRPLFNSAAKITNANKQDHAMESQLNRLQKEKEAFRSLVKEFLTTNTFNDKTKNLARLRKLQKEILKFRNNITKEVNEDIQSKYQKSPTTHDKSLKESVYVGEQSISKKYDPDKQTIPLYTKSNGSYLQTFQHGPNINRSDISIYNPNQVNAMQQYISKSASNANVQEKFGKQPSYSNPVPTTRSAKTDRMSKPQGFQSSGRVIPGGKHSRHLSTLLGVKGRHKTLGIAPMRPDGNTYVPKLEKSISQPVLSTSSIQDIVSAKAAQEMTTKTNGQNRPLQTPNSNNHEQHILPDIVATALVPSEYKSNNSSVQPRPKKGSFMIKSSNNYQIPTAYHNNLWENGDNQQQFTYGVMNKIQNKRPDDKPPSLSANNFKIPNSPRTSDHARIVFQPNYSAEATRLKPDKSLYLALRKAQKVFLSRVKEILAGQHKSEKAQNTNRLRDTNSKTKPNPEESEINSSAYSMDELTPTKSTPEGNHDNPRVVPTTQPNLEMPLSAGDMRTPIVQQSSVGLTAAGQALPQSIQGQNYPGQSLAVGQQLPFAPQDTHLEERIALEQEKAFQRLQNGAAESVLGANVPDQATQSIIGSSQVSQVGPHYPLPNAGFRPPNVDDLDEYRGGMERYQLGHGLGLGSTRADSRIDEPPRRVHFHHYPNDEVPDEDEDDDDDIDEFDDGKKKSQIRKPLYYRGKKHRNSFATRRKSVRTQTKSQK